ncbi:UDP-N-acetylmuramate dehydrogenase [Natranaerovirga pectinivora]|uniref:UDP-N-acetylenolpyruvoylglucosamine reductase n=1 Tax=Natranaerovirga pectinivora TaxID=682400 RepID=A0A4R3MHY0_9FIRM|nr:UDP-N-acetylmuramate dehydrogenase [Natranaerovirga pectinivora]TCT12856.1 UDP-N-acetylmuramate dehydrogenase [Natranaerovirga pectinivora]
MNRNYAIMHNVSLRDYNTLKINCRAQKMLFPYNEEGIKEVINDFKGKNSNIVVIGKGANILFSKEFYGEDYLFINLKLMDQINYCNERVICGAGATLSQLSWYTLENNIKGFEFLEDIPGTVGGAIIMNAGTYEDNISQLIKKIKYYDIDKDVIIEETVSIDDFNRRKSKWTDINAIVIAAEFVVKKGDYLESLDELLEIKKRRYLKQPRNYPNAGSVFKRPLVDGKEWMVWKLINDSGLRGIKKNGAMISEKHTGFIINTGDATYDDIFNLISRIIDTVYKNFGVILELEWRII